MIVGWKFFILRWFVKIYVCCVDRCRIIKSVFVGGKWCVEIYSCNFYKILMWFSVCVFMFYDDDN